MSYFDISKLNIKIDTLLLVGCGRIAEVLYLPCLSELFDNISVFDKSENRLREISEKFPSVKIFNSIPNAFNKNSIAFNLTSPEVHYELNKSLLLKGWHVFTEKVPCFNTKEWSILCQLAADKNRILTSAPVPGKSSGQERFLRCIEQNDLGDLVGIHAKFICGGPYRRGWLEAPRTNLVSRSDSIRLDLAPYILMPVIEAFNIEEVTWISNNHFPLIPILHSSESFLSKTPTYEIGISHTGLCCITLEIGYRSYQKDVINNIELVGTQSSQLFDFKETVVNGKHTFDRVLNALTLISNCCDSEIQKRHHHNIQKMLVSLGIS